MRNCSVRRSHVISALSTLLRPVYLASFFWSLTQRVLRSHYILIQSKLRARVAFHFADYQKTQFIHFHGISPRRYRDFFEKSRRKDKNGRAEEWLDSKKRPILDVKLPIYLPLEGYAQKALKLSVAKARAVLRKKGRPAKSRRRK